MTPEQRWYRLNLQAAMSSWCKTVRSPVLAAKTYQLQCIADVVGDRICIFGLYYNRWRVKKFKSTSTGFSRGAYTARRWFLVTRIPIWSSEASPSLAGMIHKVGLLPKDNHQQLPFAYKMYSRTDSVGWDQSNGFKKSFSVDVPIEFVGVWCVHHSYYWSSYSLPW